MDKSVIEHLRRLHSEATQGRWSTSPEGDIHFWEENHPHVKAGMLYRQENGKYEDAELICAMHAALPELLETADLFDKAVKCHFADTEKWNEEREDMRECIQQAYESLEDDVKYWETAPACCSIQAEKTLEALKPFVYPTNNA